MSAASAAGAAHGAAPSPAYALFAGLAASLVAIGLARFAYTPLVPLLIQAHWFAAGDVLYLGAANFAGYFIGALCGRPLGQRYGNGAMLRAMMLAASVSFIACAAPLSLAWFFAWRFLSGLSGAVVMVLVAQTVLPMVAPARRGAASGAIFMGIGAGIVASGTLVPLLLRFGLAGTWTGLGVFSALLTALTWKAWPGAAPAQPAPAAMHGEEHDQSTPAAMPLAVRLLYVEYAAVAVGLVPSAVFLVDFIARGVGRGVSGGASLGALFWILYGAGAMAGPMLYGMAADRVGYGRALRLGFALSALAAATLAWLPSTLAWVPPVPAWLPPLLPLAGASLLLGAFTPGVVTLMIGRLHELLPQRHARQHAAWSRSTTVFALFQALSGYAFSWLYGHGGGNYALLYALAGCAFLVALAVDVLAARMRAVPA